MTTASSTKFVILTCSVGKYVWWPALQIVDFIPKSKHAPKWSENLRTDKNTELEALLLASKHLINELAEIRADQRLRDENRRITDDWQ